MVITGRDFLVFFSVKYKGDWDLIMQAIEKREKPRDEEVIKTVKQVKTKFITILDEEYPTTLKQIFKPPFVLYYKGDISLISDYKKCLAVVGAREPSSYGKKNMENVLKTVVKNYVFVSGVAIGVDAHAHELSIKYGGKTVGILGCGLDIDYPKSNFELKQKISDGNLLMSEYPDGTEPHPNNFPIRNRIIVGLSKSVLVVDVKPMSGTLSTANIASDNNRNLMSFPYPLGTEFINNSLINAGCYLVENADDIEFVMTH